MSEAESLPMTDDSRSTNEQTVPGDPEKPEILTSQDLRDQITQGSTDSLLQTRIFLVSRTGLLSGHQDPDGEEAQVDGS